MGRLTLLGVSILTDGDAERASDSVAALGTSCHAGHSMLEEFKLGPNPKMLRSASKLNVPLGTKEVRPCTKNSNLCE